MTHRVAKSFIDALDFDFEAAVEEYRQALLDHRFTVDVPAPTAHIAVELSVRRSPQGDGNPDDFVADYEIIDDTPPPPPPPSFEQRKAELYHALASDEQAQINAVASPGRLRLAGMEMQRIRAIPENDRTPADVETLASALGVFAAIQAINEASARRMVEIDDLTPETIDGFAL
jgi:hypothetical protein